MILQGDCLHKLKELEDNSIDSIVTDPPYGLSFMGKRWDYDVPSIEVWRECLRVLKPGGHLLSFGGTRTYHRLAVNIEEAGFEVRDMITWNYGSGFPKSTDVSKRIDKEAGAEREVGAPQLRPDGSFRVNVDKKQGSSFQSGSNDKLSTIPSTEAAKKYQGWGTALKPALEPICVARKPLEAKLTVAANVLKWGTGALNIDASRIGTETIKQIQVDTKAWHGNSFGANPQKANKVVTETTGRWPANILFDEDAAAVLDIQAEGASRFFYVAKASKRERGEGNIHPTVKPIKLMEYLIRLVTPTNGTVLDPFMGSGTTGVAAKRLGFEFIGIEREKEYAQIAEKRIEAMA